MNEQIPGPTYFEFSPPFPDHIDTIPCHSVKLRIHLDFSVDDHPTTDHPPIEHFKPVPRERVIEIFYL